MPRIAACSALLLLGACAAPRTSYVTLLESPDGTTGKILVQGSKGEQLVDKAGYAVPLDGSSAPAPVGEALFRRDFAAAIAARPRLPQRFLLYFETGGVKLTAESEMLLPKIMETAGSYPGVDISIIGHTDTVGRVEANEALALRRAQTVSRLMATRGFLADKLVIESHGESNPLVPTPDETDEPRNRRVEVTIR